MKDLVTKVNPTCHPVHPIYGNRWSPRAFDNEPIVLDHLQAMYEAARWAPSCMGAEPWRFVIGNNGTQTFRDLLDILLAGNQVWCARAGALVLVASEKNYDNGRANTYAWHDTGMAVSQWIGQATALDYGVHCMAGFNTDSARQYLAALSLDPDHVEPVLILAVGKRDSIDVLPNEDLQKRERALRVRKNQSTTLIRMDI